MNRSKLILSLFLIFSFLTSLLVGTYLIQRRKAVVERPKAAVDTVVSIIPSSETLPPSKTFKLMVGPSSVSVGFVRAVITYDPSKIRLASDVQINTDTLDTTVQTTARATANSNGKIVIVTAASPGNTPPNTVYEVASFQMEAVTNSPNVTATLGLDASDMQLVQDGASNELSFDVQPATITLNPTQTEQPPQTSEPTAAPVTPTTPPTSTEYEQKLEAEDGIIQGSFIVTKNFILQPFDTLDGSGGRVAFSFTVPTAGNYVIKGLVSAPNADSASFFANIDSEPNTETMVWALGPTSGFEERYLRWSGDNEYHIFNLSAGGHTLIVKGREGGAQIDKFWIYSAGYEGLPPDSTIGNSRADINQDTYVNLLDYIILLENYGQRFQ